MQYIVLDLEWNQPYGRVRSDSGRGILKEEIMQIGAVKLNEQLETVDELRIGVRLPRRRRLNRNVAMVTGISREDIRQGTYFVEAALEFKSWCGNDFVFLIWGNDDISVLMKNLNYYGLPTDWIKRYYNLQHIFNRQMEFGRNQMTLQSAAEHCGIKMDKPLHDAFNDAFYTAEICKKLDMQKGILQYNVKQVIGEHVTLIEGENAALVRTNPRRLLMSDNRINRASCPTCGNALRDLMPWIKQNRGKYITLGVCQSHGKCFVSVKFLRDKRGHYASKSVCCCDDTLNAVYESGYQKQAWFKGRKSRSVSVGSKTV